MLSSEFELKLDSTEIGKKMKLYITYTFLTLFTLLISSCSKSIITNPRTSSTSQGSVSLKMDKDTAPSNAVKVVAYLYRTNYDTLFEQLNMITSTNADILFQNVPAGNWHLEVNVLDSTQAIIYTGETDVTILAGITTQVSLTLVPTGKGSGSIEITVNWGQNTPHWVDYQNNPILSVSDIPYFTLAVDQAQVMYDNGKYKMWFENLYNSGHGDVSYAESSDGISWQTKSSNPVFTVGQAGAWDDYAVAVGYIFKDNGTYKLYYAGMQDPHTGARQIGLATSTDGIHWERYSHTPVFKSDSSQYFLGVHSILKIDNVYYMYYDASPENNYKFNINLATSTDGIHWTKYSDNPILAPTESWENGSISYATIVQDEDGYKMTYGNNIQTGIGMAYSSDGVHWTKDSSNPVFDLSDVSNNWCTKISYPFSVMSRNDYRIYYSGVGSDGQYHLGVTFWR